VLVKPLEAEEKTASGLYLPDAAREKPMQGKVMAVGPGKLNDKGQRMAMTVHKGDTVIYGKYAGTDIKIDGEDHKIMQESELLAVVEK
jgi:chaperonin GroES